MNTIKYLDLAGLKTLYGVIDQKIETAKPTKVSQLTNDAGYQTASEVESIASTKAAEKVAEIVDGAPEDFDTLKEIAQALSDNDDAVASIVTTLGTKANSADVYTKTEIENTYATKSEIEGIANDFVPLTKSEIEDAAILTPPEE